MTANLNFEAESFEAFDSHGETSQEYENVRDHRTGAPGPAVRDHRTGMPAQGVRDHRIAGSAAAVRDHRTGGFAPQVRDHRFGVASVGRPGYASSRAAYGPGFRGSTAFSRRFSGFGAPGVVRGISGLFHGVPTRASWNRGWYGGRPYSGARGWFGQGRHFGDRGAFPFGDRFRHDFGRRWPWLSRDGRHGWWRDRGMGAGFGSTDAGYQAPGSSAPDYSGGVSAGSGAAPGYAGPGYSGPDSSSPDSSGAGFTPGAPAPGSGSPTASDDPQIVGWAQGCLAQIVGGWVPQDGKLGRLTTRAIGIFQNQSQLPSTGTLDDTTLTALQNACHALSAGAPAPTPGQAPPPPSPDATSAPLPNVVVPDATAGAPPATPPGTGAPPPPPPPGDPTAADPSTAAPPKQPELEYWSNEYQEYENNEYENPRPRTCEPDRCTNAYLRWLQNSLNQVFGQRLAITGTLDDPTIAAINRFRVAKRLRISESYHVGPAIEDALRAAGATPPPAVPSTQCGVSDPGKLIPILDQARGDIPLEFLLAWIDVESAWVLEPPSVTCERGYFQLYPEDSVNLGLDHDRIGTDPAYSIKSGVPFVNWARRGIERAVTAFGVPRNSDLYWRLVKLWHWIPSGPEKILAAMSGQGARATDWNSVRTFVSGNFDSLSKIIRRDPRNGIRSVDNMFRRVDAWRRQLHR